MKRSLLRSYYCCLIAVLFSTAISAAEADRGTEEGSPGGDICTQLAATQLVTGETPATKTEAQTEAASSESPPLRLLFQYGQSRCPLSVREVDLLEHFAKTTQKKIQWLYTNLEPYQIVAEGYADIAVGSIPKREDPVAGILQTLPWGDTQERLLTRFGAIAEAKPDDWSWLADRQIAVLPHSPAWYRLQQLTSEYPMMRLQELPAEEAIHTTIKAVSTGKYDTAVLGNILLQDYLHLYPDLEARNAVTNTTALVWLVNSSATALQQKLNAFINNELLHIEKKITVADDLHSLMQRKVLRMITTPQAAHYYLQQSKPLGFEHELVSLFAAKHKLLVAVQLAESTEEMFTKLQSGAGDIIAASMPLEYMETVADVAVSIPYLYSAAVIAAAPSLHEKIIDPIDLAGKTVRLATQTPWSTIRENAKSANTQWHLASLRTPFSLTESVEKAHSSGQKIILADWHQLLAHFRNITNPLTILFLLDEPQPLVWVVRKDDRRLLAELNQFIRTMDNSTVYNILYKKYFSSTPKQRDEAAFTTLSPYDILVRKYAKEYGFDWRLILALMYQESRFDPTAISYANAQGLMQLTPDTQDFMDVENPESPEENIAAGIGYLFYLRGRYEQNLLPEERTWFSLAAYNAGFNRIQSARKLADEMGLDKNRWFDNVEKAMQEMGKPFMRNGETIRRCRCGQTVVYVREIKTRYQNYLQYTANTDYIQEL